MLICLCILWNVFYEMYFSILMTLYLFISVYPLIQNYFSFGFCLCFVRMYKIFLLNSVFVLYECARIFFWILSLFCTNVQDFSFEFCLCFVQMCENFLLISVLCIVCSLLEICGIFRVVRHSPIFCFGLHFATAKIVVWYSYVSW